MYARLRDTSNSLMRDLMNLEIESIILRGRVLDAGGGMHSSYQPLLRGSTDITSVNIDAELAPSVIADLAAPLPFVDDAFDTVISFNTLEHLADDQFALDQMVRVLRPGGRAHILVPFLYRVHGHPRDYHRHTAHGWNLMLQRAGIPDAHQHIRPLVWDPFATAWALVDTAPLGRNWWRARRHLRRLVLRRPLQVGALDRRLDDDEDLVVSEYALAYTVEAQKP
jgi:SAM-dependent methyltransferase